MTPAETILDDAHWAHMDHKQRIESKQWKQILLEGRDFIVFRGVVMKLVKRDLGSGVIEISKGPAVSETRPFLCPFCSEKFLHLSVLKKHIIEKGKCSSIEKY